MFSSSSETDFSEQLLSSDDRTKRFFTFYPEITHVTHYDSDPAISGQERDDRLLARCGSCACRAVEDASLFALEAKAQKNMIYFSPSMMAFSEVGVQIKYDCISRLLVHFLINLHDAGSA